jgi:uncharacterized membrane protein (DUF373 family)
MSNLTSSDDEHKPTHEAPTHHQPPVHPRSHDTIAYFSGTLLERGDSIIYAIVGVCFFLGALFALGYSFWEFTSTIFNMQETIHTAVALHNPPPTPQEIVAGAIIKLVSDLLLVLIIMEVLSTVIHYLKSHATSLRPFLFIGIISATRGVLSIGARLSVQNVNTEEFYHAMIELAVNALAILALGITLRLLGKIADDH